MKALVTGGAGFIGSHLAARLLAKGFTVRVLDNFATGRRENLLGILDAIELVEGDIQSFERVHTAVKGCDYVFHEAALPSVPRSVQDPLTSNATNVIGTLNVLLASRDSDVRRVIFASSSSTYGPSRDLPKRESQRPEPISPYAVAKLAGEGYCQSFSRVYGLDTVVLRYFNVFGPSQDPFSQYSAVIPNFITTAMTGGSPVVFGDGEQTRDFTFIDNVVEANVQATDATGITGEVLNIACGHRVSLNSLLSEISSLLGIAIHPRYTPARPGDIRDSLADITKARELLDYAPHVDFGEGIARTIDWFQHAGSGWMQALVS